MHPRAGLIEVERLIRDKLAEHRQMLADLNLTIAKLETALKEMEGVRSPATRTGGARKGRPRSRSGARQVREFARTALISAGRPLTRAELLERMTAVGEQPDSTDPARFIGKSLGRADGFVNTGDGYWLADHPLPQKDPTRNR